MRKGTKHKKETRKKMSLAKQGKKRKPFSEEHRKRLGEATYKGDRVGYRGLHKWVEKELGKSCFCEKCGNRELRHRQYHWSNISGKYLRKLSDWIRLCVKCHKAFDKNK